MTNTDAKIMREAALPEERIVAAARLLSRMGDLIQLEELALAAWPGQCGRREQEVRISALKRAYEFMADKLRQDTPS